tara:strand:- start:99 stop:200 length:102 start_codon:yes stop_codon:yes gene_type:complete
MQMRCVVVNAHRSNYHASQPKALILLKAPGSDW